MRTRPAAAPNWSLSPRAHEGSGPAERALAHRTVLTAVARRGLPGIVEASLVPSLIFLLVTGALGAVTAMIAVLAWGFGAIVRRVVCGKDVPTVLLLATSGLTVKTVIGVASGSTFAYFLQPVATTLAVGGLFFGSVLFGRPLIARIAHDFCPIAPEVAARPSVGRLFVGLTVLWASVQLVNAGATVGMLVSLPTSLFVVLKPAASLLITAAAVTVTVCWALRTAHREELVFVTS